MSLADPKPGARLFTYDISSATWLSDELQSGTVSALAKAAMAYDLGKEVLWVYGGATYTDDGEPSGDSTVLWKAPGLAASDPDCVANSTESGDGLNSACQVNTTTASEKRRPTTQATMVLIDVVGTSASSGRPGSEGVLILLGGQGYGTPVCYRMSNTYLSLKTHMLKSTLCTVRYERHPRL